MHTREPSWEKWESADLLRKFLKSWVGSGELAVERFEFIRPTLPAASEFSMRLVRREMITPQTIELDFQLAPDQRFTFVPGQYINLVLPEDPSTGLRREVRSYSIWNHPNEDDTIRIIARIVSEGRATAWLQSLAEGQSIDFVGPLGNFHLRRPLHKHLYFIGTGTGLVPLRSMLQDLLNSGEIERHDIKIIVGFRTNEDAIHFQEFEQLDSAYANVEFMPTFSEPQESWTGARGYVTEQLGKQRLDVDNIQVYLSGNGAMIGDVIDLLESRGLSRQTRRIICEKFFDKPRSTAPSS